MKQRIGTCVGLLALALVGAGDANAQVTVYGPGYYGGYYGPRYYQPRYYNPGVRPARVMRIVQSAGYAPLSAPLRRGPNYFVAAVGRGGGHVWVVVNAHEGAIVSVRPNLPTVALRSPGLVPNDPRVATVTPTDRAPPTRDAPSADADRGAHKPLPPMPPPSQRVANAPATAAVPPMPPERTPVPRPRPSVATNEAPATTGTTPAPAAAAPKAVDVPEAPPAPRRAKPATPMVPVAPLD